MAKWPRGRWNGWRIVGFRLNLVIDITNWSFHLPRRYTPCVWLGPVRLYYGAEYDVQPGPEGL